MVADIRPIRKPGSFHPVIPEKDNYHVLDLSRGCDPAMVSLNPPSIGRYNEKRENMYTNGLFEGKRNIHVGLDFFVPAETPVFAFDDGEIVFFRDNNRTGDYGPTVITSHSGPGIQRLLKQITKLQKQAYLPDSSGVTRKGDVDSNTTIKTSGKLYALYGHLSRRSLENLSEGKKLARGEAFAVVGDENENGGWIPHLHFQLSLVRPDEPDMPGVVSKENLSEALQRYPDPQLVTGRYY